MVKELTHKQELACRKYIECGNKSEAYRLAYDCSKMKDESVHRTAFEFFKDLKITSRISELRTELFNELNINIYSITKDFKELKERGMKKIPVTDDEGNEVGVWKYDASTALKANVELAKISGLYNNKEIQNPNVKVVFSLPNNGRDGLSNLSDQELVDYQELLKKINSKFPIN